MSDQTVTISQDEYNALRASKDLADKYEQVLTKLVNMTGIVNRDDFARELLSRNLMRGIFNDPTNG